MQQEDRHELTTLPVNVPVLSKQATLTFAVALSFPTFSTCMPFDLSFWVQAKLEVTITVGMATGTAEMSVFRNLIVSKLAAT